MTPVQVQYIVDDQQSPKAVVVPVEDWERIVEDLEELDDIRAYEVAKSGSQDAILLDQAVREIQEGQKG